MTTVAAVHYGIDNQFSDAFRRKLVIVFPVNAIEPVSQMNASEHKLKCVFNLLPQRTGITTLIDENSSVGIFEYTALNQ